MNETLSVIAGRYSCRRYTDQKLTKEELETLAKAAVQSPSAMNRQPWTIHVVTGDALLADLEAYGMDTLRQMTDQSAYERIMSRGGKLFYGTPCMIILSGPDGSELDCGIVSENIALAAASMGLGNVICGMAVLCFDGPRGEEFAQRVGFPQGDKFRMSVLVGHGDAPATPHEPDLSKVRYVD